MGNRPTGTMIVTSVVSFVLLLGGIGGLAWFFAASRETWRSEPATTPADPLIGTDSTPSMRATHKYFWIVGGMAVAQIAAGIVTAHYGVEGTEFYGIALAEIVPYSLSRTWHVQLGMLWIATSWLATGLCLVPLITGREPRFQQPGSQPAAGGPAGGRRSARCWVRLSPSTRFLETGPTSGSGTRGTSTSTWDASGRPCSWLACSCGWR